MKNEESTLSPLHYLMMSILGMPYLSLKFGLVALVGMTPLTAIFVFKSYQFYTKRATRKGITFVDAIAEDLPDMSPVHIFLFSLIAAPIVFPLIGSTNGVLMGVGLVYTIYTVYYYGFKPKG